MKPTQAHIEAAKEAYEKTFRSIGISENPLHQEALEAALTAAAEAGEIKLNAEIERLRRQRTEFDCRYTLGDVADMTGSHCPLDSPCMRCQNERLRAALKEATQWFDQYRPQLGPGTLPTWYIDAGKIR